MNYIPMYLNMLIASFGLFASIALSAPLQPRQGQKVLIFGGATEGYYTVEPPHGVDFSIGIHLFSL